MQQRQPRLGDVLDDYCPRERRLTNHAVVAMVGEDIKQTRCMTCDSEHEYKHAKIPRQRRKGETPAALYSQVAAGAPKRVVHEPADQPLNHEPPQAVSEADGMSFPDDVPSAGADALAAASDDTVDGDSSLADGHPDDADGNVEEGPVHRPLIRATLPRPEGQAPPARPAPEFTIRQPGGGRPNRFRPRQQRGGGAMFSGNRGGNVGGPSRNGATRFSGNGNRPPQSGGGGGRRANQNRQNRKRFK